MSDRDDAPKLTPVQQAAYDDMRASPGILIAPDGMVIFDGEAEAMGATPFKTRVEIEAAQAKLQVLLAERRKAREAAAAKADPTLKPGNPRRFVAELADIEMMSKGPVTVRGRLAPTPEEALAMGRREQRRGVRRP